MTDGFRNPSWKRSSSPLRPKAKRTAHDLPTQGGVETALLVVFLVRDIEASIGGAPLPIGVSER
jgi:hypothetical protein